MAGTSAATGLVGARIPRKENFRILTGAGRYVDDVQDRALLHCYFLRSPVPHGRITGINIDAARRLEGVIAVYTGADMSALTNDINFAMPIPGLNCPTYPVLARDTVRYVGEPVALVVAESRYLAEDAAALIDVDYDSLEAVISTTEGLAEGAPQLFDEVPGNVIHADDQTFGDIEAAFAQADHVVTETFSSHRWGTSPMETRGGVATFDRSTGQLTYEASTQATYMWRFFLSGILNQPLHQFRVIANDVGGGFGLKISPYREDAAVCAAARHLGGMVKWVEDRQEHLVAAGAAREEQLTAEAAVTADGTLLGLRVHVTMDHGAYPVIPPAPVFVGLMRQTMPTPYRLPAYQFSSQIVATNKASYISLRGPGAVTTLVRERLLDKIAGVVGISPTEMRRRNLLTLDDQPTKSVINIALENIAAVETLERLVTWADLEAVRRDQEQARAEGRLIGFGIATSAEPAPGNADFWAGVGFPFETEPARVRIEIDGKVTIFTQQVPHGQSHETTCAQVIGDELGVAFEDVRVVFGDTDHIPFAMIGTGGSRAGLMATGAVALAARELRRRILDIAAALLGAEAANLLIENGVISVKGSPEIAVPLAQISMGCYLAPDQMPAGLTTELEYTAHFDGEGGGFAPSSHACWVEIDQRTGKVQISRYLVVHDCGRIINPAVVEGQLVGGIAMGIGGMLYEESAYGPDGQYLAATFMDYLMPTAAEIPEIEFEHLELTNDRMFPSLGVGEVGTVLAPAALLNAIDDALAQVGRGRVVQTPLTPTRILELLGVLESPA